MKKTFNNIFIIICMLIIISFSLYGIQKAINVSFEKGWLTSSWTLGECLNFYASFFTGICTLILGIIAIWQTNKANEINKRLLNKELLDNYCFIQLEPKIELIVNHNQDSKITMSAHHKFDNGATIAIEKDAYENESFNEYYIKLFFKDASKTSIKEIKIENLLCVQDPSKDSGMYWEDGSKDPIPCGLHIEFINKVQLNWISNDEFYTHLKVYSPRKGCFSNMMENKVQSCLMFEYTITSISNVQTKILFKIWLKKNKGGKIEVIHTNTNIIEEKLLK